MLGTLENSQKADWKKYVNHLVYCYNCTPHESTRVAPFEIMFGRKPRLPIDTLFEQANDSLVNKGTKEYIMDLKEKMLKTRRIVDEYVSKAKKKQKKYYDTKAKAARIEVGDKVLVKVLSFEGKHKIADKFEEDVYSVIEQVKDNIPVYKVKSDVSGRVKTLHRNHLYLLQHQDNINGENQEVDVVEKEDASNVKEENGIDRCDVTEIEEESESDDDTGDLVVFTRSGDAHNPVVVKDKVLKERTENKKVSIDMPIDLISDKDTRPKDDGKKKEVKSPEGAEVSETKKNIDRQNR
ncbi:uncharacterized protein LOC128558704 [Mercenaria mercenaria]|uniref:uncharacterized protein LOC128558704 n=1 Tax=Mercenaria mercenaria TaxID=6596 RepID=UPI00234E9D5E|nr:uncharacterized protein LOC128558704 [Mercenaria mercenaria]